MISLINGNAFHIPLASGTVQCCITSPPYWGLRDYGIDGQLGLEPTPEEYVSHLVDVFREVWSVLRPDGVLWLNLGDTYAGSGGAGGDYSPGGLREGQPTWKNSFQIDRSKRNNKRWGGGNSPASSGLKPKDLVGIPWRVAFALQADGWWLRSDIIWAKPNPMPESVTDRPTKSHEYIFLLAKSEKYYYDAEAVKETAKPEHFGRYKYDFWPDGTKEAAGAGRPNGASNTGGHKEPSPTRNRRSVWSIPTTPYSGVSSDGKYRIASRDCPVHDYQADLESVLEYDAQLSASDFLRSLDTDSRLVQSQEGAVVSIPLYHRWFLSDVSFAIPRNMRMNKTEAELEQDVIFYGIPNSHTEYTVLVRRSIARFCHKNENKTLLDAWLDVQDFDPLAQTIYRIFGIVTFRPPEKECTCYYTGKVEKRQDHFAVFPPALVEPCILAGSRSGDLVLDPFAGTATVGKVAIKHQRNFVGLELNPEYIQLARKRVNGTQIAIL